jgi:hypothetical protein
LMLYSHAPASPLVEPGAQEVGIYPHGNRLTSKWHPQEEARGEAGHKPRASFALVCTPG